MTGTHRMLKTGTPTRSRSSHRPTTRHRTALSNDGAVNVRIFAVTLGATSMPVGRNEEGDRYRAFSARSAAYCAVIVAIHRRKRPLDQSIRTPDHARPGMKPVGGCLSVGGVSWFSVSLYRLT